MKKRLKEEHLNLRFYNYFHFMRKPCLLIFVSIIGPFVSLAGMSSLQSTKISLKKNNVTLSSLITEIEKQSGHSILVRLNDLDMQEKISVDFHDEPLDRILDSLFEGKNIGYEIDDKTISIFKANENISNQLQPARKIKGKVVDEMNEPLIGVNIRVKGEKTGTITDFNGYFELEATPSDIVEISYVGFITQSIAAGKTEYNITLLEDTKTLDEVVVIGFGSQKKTNLTGAVSTVQADAFEGRAVQNVSMMLQGLVPGLVITKGTGTMDSAPSINIRGTTTIGEGSSGSPLILIDGMEGDLNLLNPQDIESVSVLKDAAASSIYGSRAPFGVILITTKTGKDGRFHVNYNNSFRYSTAIKRPHTVDSYRFATYFNDAEINAKRTGKFTPERMQRIRDFMDGKITSNNIPDPNNPANWADGYDYANDNVDWWDVIYKKWNFSQEHTASVSGGTEKLQMYASINYLGMDGMIKVAEDTYERYATNLKITSQLNKKLHINYNIRFSRSDYDRPAHLGRIEYFGYQTWPVLPVYDDNGYLFSSPSPALYLREGGRDKTKNDWIGQQARLIYKPIDGLEIVGEINHSLGYSRNHWDTQKIYNYNVAGERIPNTSSTEVYEYTNRNDYIAPNAYATYNLTLADSHNIKIMGGFQSESVQYDNFTARRNGLIIPGMDVIKGTDGTDGNGQAVPPSVSGEKGKWAVAGFFGRLNYDFKERYLFEMNIRHDGTSRFRSDKRWKTFPSASIGWNIAREEFWDNYRDLISTFKFRGSYGVLGNQNTTEYYPTYITMPIGTSNGEWIVNGRKPNTANAPGLISSSMTWETVKSLNLGLDINMLSNRLNFTAEWYQRDTKDMIGPAPELPVILGTGVPKTNNTDLRTKGWELFFTWRDVIANKINYFITFNLYDYRTTITNYPNENYNLDTYYTGQKLGDIWGYETIGIAKTQEEMDKHLSGLPNGGQSPIGSDWEAGDIMYKDLNGDGVINNGANTLLDHGDLKVIGNNRARYNFGLNVGGEWKGLDVSLFFQGVMKRDYWEGGWHFWGRTDYIWRSVAYEEHMDYFRADPDHYMGQNLNAYYPRPYDGSSKNQRVQTGYLQNASYIRLKNIQVGYSLPKEWLSHIGITRCKVYFSGENLWTGTKLRKMLDPEQLGFGTSSMGYPLSKTISFGLSITL